MIRILSEDITANKKLDSPLYLYDNESISLQPYQTLELEVTLPQGRLSFDADAVWGPKEAVVEVEFGAQARDIYVTNARQFGSMYVNEQLKQIKLTNKADAEVTIKGLSIFDGNFEDMVVDIAPRKVIEEKRINAEGWLLQIESPIAHKDFFKKGYLVQVKTKEDGLQYFRMGNIEVQKYVVRTVAKHVFFDTMDYIVMDGHLVEASPALALTSLNNKLDRPSPFTTSSTASDRNVTMDFDGKSLFECIEELRNIFDMKLEINNWDFGFKTEMGEDRGTQLAYGKNIQDIKVFEDWDNVCTKLLPIGSDDVRIPETFLYSSTVYNKVYAKAVNFSLTQPKEIEVIVDEKPVKQDNELARIAELKELGERYLIENQFPKLAYQVNSDIDQTLRLWDTVHVKHPAISPVINANSTLYPSDFVATTVDIPVTSYSYDILSGKVDKIEYGSYSSALSNAIGKVADKIEKDVGGKLIDQEGKLKEQTDLINNLNKNGHVIVYENEILMLDELPKENAKSVWKLGAGGIGLSKTGIDGDFITAWDINGNLSADVITAGTLEGSLIKAESIYSHSLSLEAKEFIMSLTKTGGSNLLRNSVFFAGTKYWNASAQATQTYDTWVLQGVAKCGVKFTAKTANSSYWNDQEISADLTKAHVFKTKLNKVGKDGLFFVRVQVMETVNDKDVLHEVMYREFANTETFDGTIAMLLPTIEITDPLHFGNNRVMISIGIKNMAPNNYALITDTIVAKGIDVEWSQAEGELYGTDVLIDGDGLSVTRRDPASNSPIGTTVMNPYEFAGYYGDERVFTLNGDITEVDGLLVKKQGVKVPPIQMVQNLSGSMFLDIIWVGKD